MARPSKLTPELQERACELAERGLAMESIADGIGVDVATLFRWIQLGKSGRSRYASFAIAFARARSHLLAKAAQVVTTAVTEGQQVKTITRSSVRHPQTGELMLDSNGRVVVDLTERTEHRPPDARLALEVLARISPEQFGRHVSVDHRHRHDPNAYMPREIRFLDPDGAVIENEEKANEQGAEPSA